MTDGRRNPRTPYPTQVPGIPKPPAGTPPALQRYLTNLSEALEIRLGRKGDVRDRAITLRELIESGLAVDLANNPYDPNNPGNDFGGTVVPDSEVPPAPTNFSAVAGFSNVGLFWDWPGYQYRGHSFTEIWRNTTDNLNTATLIGVSPGMAYTDVITTVTTATTFYYWARHVNVNDVEGPFHANAGLAATLAANPNYLLDVLTDQITNSQLVQTLRDPIGRIPDIETYIGYSPSYTGSSLLNRILASESDLNGIINILPKDSNGNIIAVPSAAAFYSYQAKVDQNELDIASNASAISAVVAQIPVDSNGNYLSLASASALTALTGTVTSQGNTITANSNAITAVEAVLPVDSNGNFLNTASATALTTLDGTVTNQGNTISANSSAITAVQAVLPKDVNGNLVNTATASGLSTLEATVNDSTSGLSATVSRVDTLQTEVFNANGTSRLASLSVTGQIESDLDTVEAQYTVKISQDQPNGNTYVTGYGLATTDVDGTPSSAFIVAADKFAVINPSTYSGGMDTTPTNVPFIVQSTAQTVTLASGEQVNVPAGVYMREAFLSKATVLQLIAGSVTADFVLASTFIRAPNIHGGTFNIGSFSTNNSSDPSDWTISGSNRVSNFSVDANGIMHCEAAQLKAVTVLADDGTVLLDAGGTIVGGGANMIPNGQLYPGPSSPSTFVWGDENSNTEIIPFWEVADSNVGNTTGSYVSYWTSSFAGVMQLFYGSTFRMQEFLPCAEDEVYYLAVDNFMNNNSLQWSVAVQFSDSSKTFVTQTSLSPTSSLWDDPPVSYVQGVGSPTSGTRYSVAQITVPSNSNIRYMRVRFSGGSFTGTSNHYVNIKSVYLSKVPPVIGPKYASTYIRNLSVDTLQIAGNAVTVPIGQSNVNVGQYVTWSGTNSDTATGSFWGTAANTGSVGGVTAIPLSWTSNDVRPDALTITACANFLGQSGSAWKTIRARIVYSTSPSFTSVTQIQIVGASLATNFSTTLSVNATLDASSLSANTNYYFALQMHGNDQGGVGSTPWKIGQNGISVLAAKK